MSAGAMMLETMRVSARTSPAADEMREMTTTFHADDEATREGSSV